MVHLGNTFARNYTTPLLFPACEKAIEKFAGRFPRYFMLILDALHGLDTSFGTKGGALIDQTIDKKIV